jgi:diacylglycerol kinase family enzyme
MKYVYVLNSFGNNYNNELYQMIDQISNELNIDHSIEVNSDSYSTEDILNKYKASRSIIVPVGGDGMINRVINVMDFNNNLLFPIPYGTGNDFCRSLRREFNDGIHLVDLVKINNKFFINTACFGIDSFIANSSIIRNKYIPKKLRYIVSSIISLFRYKMIEYKLYINDEIISGIKSTIAICNGMYYGGGFKIAPNSRLDDGKLDVYVAEKMSKLKMLI